MVTVTGVPNINTLGGAQDFGNLTQQLSDSWIVASAFPSLNDIPGVKSLKDGFASLANFLVDLLEIVNQILQAVKTFVVAYANPIQTLSKILLEQVQLLIKDIRQIGLYLTSDAALFKEGWPLSGLRGGYAAYEQRMIARLTDQTDPTRPDVSDQTYVLGMFFYLSTDITKVYQLIKSVQQLLNLFGFSFGEPSQGLPALSQPTVRYGFSQNNLVSSITTSFKSSSSPLSIATLEWTLTPPAGSDPSKTVPLPSPQGFVLEVAVEGAEELALVASRPSASQGGATTDAAGGDAEPRDTLQVVDADGNPILIRGGADLISINSSTSVSTAFNGDSLKPGASFYTLTYTDKAKNELIPPDKLKSDDGQTYYLQRTFKMSQAEILMDPSVGVYRYSLALSDLPHKASFTKIGSTYTVTDLGPSKNYTVRVSAISDEADKYAPDNAQFALKYNLTVAPAPTGDVVANLLGGAKPSSQRGAPSPKAQMTFATKAAGDFFASLQSALALLVLLRADLKIVDTTNTDASVISKMKEHKQVVSGEYAQSVLPFSDGKGTELELFVDSLFARLVPTDKATFFRGNGTTPQTWCSGLSGRLNILAEDLYQRMGSLPAIETYLTDNTVELREFTLNQICEGKFQTGIAVGIDEYAMMGTTILGSVLGRDKNGGTLQGNAEFGLASSPFQAFDQFNQGSPYSAVNEGPYLWYNPSKWTLLDAVTIQDVDAVLFDETDQAAAKAQMARLGWALGTRAEFEVGSSTEQEYLKLKYFPNRSQVLFQSEGFPSLYRYNQFNTAFPVSYIPYRALFDTPTGRKVMQQAQLILNVAASTLNTQDGQWFALRFGNTIFSGELTTLLTKFNNYIKAINNAFAAATKVIVDYINFLQARIRELQRFISLINYYIQQLDLFVIPQMAVLTVIAPGTAGVLSAFTAANNKPADGPATYGAGAALVVPLLGGSKFILDIIAAWQKDQAGG